MMIIASLLLWGRAAFAAEEFLIDKVVAVVNDDVITLSQLQQEGKPLIDRIREESGAQGDEAQKEITQRQILDALILRRLQLQEAQKENVVVSDEEVAATIERVKEQNRVRSDAEFAQALAQQNLTLEDFKTKIREQLVVDRLLIRKVRSTVVISDEEITRYYHDHAAEYRQPATVRLRHILIGLAENPSSEAVAQARTRATEVFEKLKNGADFAKAAAEYSDGAAAKEGGDLGTIRKGELHPALESAAFSLEPGGISDVIQTPAGFNIIKVEERMGGDVPTGKVKEQIRQLLFREKFEKGLDAYLAELKEKAYIEVRLDK
ncbi:MAG: peptidylprolyl isomerase [Candidatus Methylomirabilales bacterium]